MSDEMLPVRSAIPGYAGHADVHARRLADQQVRAWVGERLAALRERLPLADDTPAFDDLIMRCQFGDQHVIKALEDGRFADPERSAAVETEDGRLLAAAAGADHVDAAGLAAFTAVVLGALQHRATAIEGLRGR